MEKFKISIKVFCFISLFSFLFAIPASILFKILTHLIDSQPTYLFTTTYLVSNFGEWYIFYPLILGPITEEVIFRLPLNISRKNLVISVVVGTLFCFNSSKVSCYLLLMVAYLIFLLSLFFMKQIRVECKIHYSCFFYLLAFIFTSLHLSAFTDVTIYNLIICIIRLVPIFIMTVGLGIIRCTLGIKYSILIHILYNTILSSFSYF